MKIPSYVQQGAIGVVLLLVVVSLYRTFSTANELQQALETVQRVQTSLSATQDSLTRARAEVMLMTQEISHRQQELLRVRERVEDIDQQYEAQRAASEQPRNILHAQWQQREAVRRELHHEAQRFITE